MIYHERPISLCLHLAPLESSARAAFTAAKPFKNSLFVISNLLLIVRVFLGRARVSLERGKATQIVKTL
jgi:hypothetical protein